MKDDLTKWTPEPGKPITMGDIYCHGGDWAECCRRAELAMHAQADRAIALKPGVIVGGISISFSVKEEEK